MTALFADVVKFSPTAGGTTDWTFSSVVQGYQAPAAGGMVNGQNYKYRAESSDLTQWEVGEGTWNSSTSTLSRASVLYNSAGTTAKISFTAVPIVGVVALNSDLQNAKRTRTVVTSGSGTYTTFPGCKAINVQAVGGGGGGAGSSTGATAGGNGGNTTFGTMLAGAGAGGLVRNVGASGGTASNGDINIVGGAGGGSVNTAQAGGGHGGVSYFGGGGGTAASGNVGQSGQAAGSGGAGGAAGTDNWSGAGGGAGGYCEKLIVSPASTYSYAVGAGGSAGTGVGGTGAGGGAGAAGIIIIDEYY